MDATQYDNAPQEVKDILDTFDENKDSYAECERIVNELNEIGWTADYYLDGVLFDLQNIEDFQILASDIDIEEI
jgi:hypothetical protein